MNVNKPMHNLYNGFTLLELILVIAIIGILSVVVLPKRMQNALAAQYQARLVLNDIRYAQAMSMSTGQRYRWIRTSANTYQIRNAAGAALLLPNGSNTLTLANGTSFGNMTNLPNTLLAFDALGRPYTDTATPGASLSTTASISIVNGSDTSTITIQPTTGLGLVT